MQKQAIAWFTIACSFQFFFFGFTPTIDIEPIYSVFLVYPNYWHWAYNSNLDKLLDNKKQSSYKNYSVMAPPTGLEPVTSWLTVMRSTDWAMEEYSAKHLIRCFACVGISLSFRAVTSQVFSAPLSLTSVFGMGTGGPSASSTPTILLYLFFPYLRSLYHLHGDSCGNRTRVAGVRGRSLNRLTNEPSVCNKG